MYDNQTDHDVVPSGGRIKCIVPIYAKKRQSQGLPYFIQLISGMLSGQQGRENEL